VEKEARRQARQEAKRASRHAAPESEEEEAAAAVAAAATAAAASGQTAATQLFDSDIAQTKLPKIGAAAAAARQEAGPRQLEEAVEEMTQLPKVGSALWQLAKGRSPLAAQAHVDCAGGAECGVRVTRGGGGGHPESEGEGGIPAALELSQEFLKRLKKESMKVDKVARTMASSMWARAWSDKEQAVPTPVLELGLEERAWRCTQLLFLDLISASDANWCIRCSTAGQKCTAVGKNRLTYPRFQLHPIFFMEMLQARRHAKPPPAHELSVLRLWQVG
jgi:hypothetical protein